MSETKSAMPERIWADRFERYDNKWFTGIRLGTEYIRADLVQDAVEALEKVRHRYDCFDDLLPANHPIAAVRAALAALTQSGE